MVGHWNSDDLEARGGEYGLDFGLSVERAAEAVDVEETLHWQPDGRRVKSSPSTGSASRFHYP